MKKPLLLTTLCRRAVLCVAALTAVLTTETARAQYLQVKAGGGLSTLYSGARAVGAYKFGVGYEYELGQRWSIAPALTFSGKGWKDPDRAVHLTDDDDRPLYNDDGTPRYGVMSRSAAACWESPAFFRRSVNTSLNSIRLTSPTGYHAQRSS